MSQSSRSARLPVHLLFSLAAMALLAGCQKAANERGEVTGAAASAEVSDGAPPPRRPSRRYYLARTSERCEVYSVDGDAIDPPEAAACPADLQVGERIRIAGKTCIREGTREPDRAIPVVCPDPLTNRERFDREGPPPPPSR